MDYETGKKRDNQTRHHMATYCNEEVHPQQKLQQAKQKPQAN